ncbi:MAG: CAP domain-containing protein, partial [Chloroflexi bacterium]|nr:CAP domain-containing protein [Chloroflexota bacterium]
MIDTILRREGMRFASAALAATVMALALVGTMSRPAGAASLDSSEADLVSQVNAFRAARGLPTLTVSDTITNAAKWMATDMSVNDYFAHTSLDGRTPTQRMADAGYPAYTTWTGEDLAAGYTSAAEVMQGWINSPAHYAVLTNPAYRAIGVGRSYSAGSTYQWYWAANFGGVVDAASSAAVASFDSGFHS